MAAKTLESRINTDSFSHASGSVPEGHEHPNGACHLFPRKWECSLYGEQFDIKTKPFPTQVGVFLFIRNMEKLALPFSHVSGSVPCCVYPSERTLTLFPRKWEQNHNRFGF